MAKKAKIDLPVAPLRDLMRWWQFQKTRGVIIGGLAVALLGRPRVTRDVDGMVLLPAEEWPAFLKAGKKFGFVSRDIDTLEFAREARVLLLRHKPTSIDVDISLGELVFEQEAVTRARMTAVAGVIVPLPTPEDLIIMKAIAHRDQDLLDIDGLLAAHTTLDRRRMRRWIRIFADALEMPEIRDDLEKLLVRRPDRKRPK